MHCGTTPPTPPRERLLDVSRIPPLEPQPVPEVQVVEASQRPGRPEPQPCLCGGLISPLSAADIPAAVATHNETAQHLTWHRRYFSPPTAFDGLLCGAWMPRLGTTCARLRGHNPGHRSRASLDEHAKRRRAG